MTGAHAERLREQLTPWLAERLQGMSRTRVSDVEVSAPEASAAGQSNETVTFEATWVEDGHLRRGDYVLRREPSTSRLLPDPDVIREFSTLRALQGTDVPVPRVLGAEPDPAVLGVPFFVMERVAGLVPAAKPSIHTVGWLTTLEPGQRVRLWEQAMNALVRVHAVPWRKTHAFLTDSESSAGDVGAHLRWFVRWYDWVTRGRTYPITDAALNWLLHRQDEVCPGERVLAWGDARVGNMIFSQDLSVASVIDWEFATIGPPELDVAYWLVFDEFLTTAGGFDRLPGWPDRAGTCARYEALSGRVLRDLEYYELLAALFVAVTLIRQADIGVGRGRLPPETSMGHNNTLTQMLARRLGMPVPELSPDFLAHRRIPRS